MGSSSLWGVIAWCTGQQQQQQLVNGGDTPFGGGGPGVVLRGGVFVLHGITQVTSGAESGLWISALTVGVVAGCFWAQCA
jgi:hypothetical protein